MLTQKKLKAVFFIPVSIIQLQFTKQQLSFSLCEVLAGLSWALHGRYTFSTIAVKIRP